jgi:hypothetical protein
VTLLQSRSSRRYQAACQLRAACLSRNCNILTLRERRSNAINFHQHAQRNAFGRDAAGNVIETHDHQGGFKEWPSVAYVAYIAALTDNAPRARS